MSSVTVFVDSTNMKDYYNCMSVLEHKPHINLFWGGGVSFNQCNKVVY